jgi:uncharacterized protein GlcG (DUF336 family)
MVLRFRAIEAASPLLLEGKVVGAIGVSGMQSRDG